MAASGAIVDDDQQKEFEECLKKWKEHVANKDNKVEKEFIVEMYALEMQGTEGNCTKGKPWFFQNDLKGQYEAWM